MSAPPSSLPTGTLVDVRDVSFGYGERPALEAVSFGAAAGELVGLVGPNGAGKSTLLKLLSRITTPTAGRAWIRGRVGALLEVGTGFHQELTGRENVFLYGAILGMPVREIGAKFDQIVEFAGVSEFIDTPVKRYSSGMYVRLAFAVAAHLDTRILFVDASAWYYGTEAAYFRRSLDELGYVYDQHPVKILPRDVPTVTDFLHYDLVIWSSPFGSPLAGIR